MLIIGLVFVAIMGWQSYLIYTLRQQVRQMIGQAGSVSVDDLFGNKTPEQDFFGNDKWDPYREFQRMQQDLDRTFGDAFSRFHLNRGFSSITKMPAMDLKEEADRYVVTIDIPGADTSSLSVNLNGRQLSVTVNTVHEDEETGRNKPNFQRRERFTGAFDRSITLPGPVKDSAMKSDYKDGVLTIVIPKA